MAKPWNGVFNIKQGTTWNRTITFKNTDLTGFTARMFLKRDKLQPVADKELTTANGKISIEVIVDDASPPAPTESKVTIEMTPSDTAALSAKYYFDLELVSGTSAVMRPVEGIVQIDGEVTR